jgi:hypothetical protein
LLFLTLLALLGESAYEVLSLRATLTEVKHSAESGGAALGRGDTEEARRQLTRSGQFSERAISLSHRPVISAVSALPVIGPDATSLQAISSAARFSSEAGLKVVEAAETLGVQGTEVGASIYENGTVDFVALGEAQPSVVQAENLLDRAQQELDRVSDPLIGAVARARDDASKAVGESRGTVHKAVSLFGVLPGLLGADSPQRFLLTFEALGESRGTGGVAGLYGLLEADEGHLNLAHIGPYEELQPGLAVPRVHAPAWFQQAYGSQYSTRQWQQANLSPSFPEVARVFSHMYEQATGESIDGVVSMDPIVLRALMVGTGPVDVPGGKTVGEDQIVDLLLKDIYLNFDTEEEQNAFLGALVSSFWNKVEAGDFDANAFAAGVGTSVHTHHLKMYTADKDAEAALVELGAAGSLEAVGPSTQMVFNNNYAVNKVDYFLRKDINTHITIAANGDALVRTQADLQNGAPTGPASLLLGPGIKGDDPGLNRSVLTFLLPRNSQLRGLTIDGEKQEGVEYLEEDNPVAWSLLEIPAGGDSKAIVEYRVSGLLSSLSADSALFSFTTVPQPAVVPEKFDLQIEAPPGFIFLSRNGEDLRPSSAYRWSGKLESEEQFDLILTPK